MSIKFRTEKVTPDMAKQMLENTSNFRKLNRHRVARYANDMTADQWRATGDTIKFSNGELIDGQHRLQAVIECGRTIEFAIADGVDESAVCAMDHNLSRTLPQVLHYAGFKQVRHLAPVARACMAYEAGIFWNRTAISRQITDAKCLLFVKTHEQRLMEAINATRTLHTFCGTQTIVAVIGFVASHPAPRESELFRWFVKSLRTGESLDCTQPVLSVRNQLMGQGNQRELARNVRWALVITAWNRTLENKPGKVIVRLTGPAQTGLPDIVMEKDYMQE